MALASDFLVKIYFHLDHGVREIIVNQIWGFYAMASNETAKKENKLLSISKKGWDGTQQGNGF